MNEEIEALFPFYALGTLDEEERTRVEAYVAENPEARALLDEMAAATELLPFAAEATPPAAAVKERLMARIREEERARTRSTPAAVPVMAAERPLRRQRWPRFQLRLALPALAILAVAVALIAGLWALRLSRQVADLESRVALLQADADALQGELLALEEENRALASQLSTTASEIALLEEANEELRQQLAAQEQILAILTSPESQTVAIADTGAQPGARGSLTIHQATETAVLTVANLDPLEQDRVYQLWLIQDGQPVSAGTFDVDQDGRETLLVPYGDIGSFDAIGVSIEPEGGSEAPMGEIVLLEEVSF